VSSPASIANRNSRRIAEQRYSLQDRHTVAWRELPRSGR